MSRPFSDGRRIRQDMSEATEAMRGIVLDLDGTLLDHRGSVQRALAAWLPDMGATADEDLVQAWFRVEQQHFAVWRSGRISFAEQRRRRLRDFLPLVGREPGLDAELDGLFADYLVHYERCWAAFDDVEPFLSRLVDSGLPVVVLTNGATQQQRAKVAALGLHERLRQVLTAGSSHSVRRPENQIPAATTR